MAWLLAFLRQLATYPTPMAKELELEEEKLESEKALLPLALELWQWTEAQSLVRVQTLGLAVACLPLLWEQLLDWAVSGRIETQSAVSVGLHSHIPLRKSPLCIIHR